MTNPSLPQLQIVGLIGLAGSGKDTVADILVSHLGFIKLAFADALRNEVCAAFGIDASVLTTRETKEAPLECLALSSCSDLKFYESIVDLGVFTDGPESYDAPRSPRQIMQWWGTEYRRSQTPNYWLNKMRAAIAKTAEDAQRIVITDVRFENEALQILDLGERHNVHATSQLWQVDRWNNPHQTNTNHHSESGQAAWLKKIPRGIYKIHNDHGIADLVGPVLLHWLAMESRQTLGNISSSKNAIDGWAYH